MRENNLISNHTHAIVVNTVTLSYDFAQLIFHFIFGSGPHKRFYKEALGMFNAGNTPNWDKLLINQSSRVHKYFTPDVLFLE